MFKYHTVHCSKLTSHVPPSHQLLCPLITFPCFQLHFCFMPPLHSCHTSSTPTLVMTPALCHTVGHFTPTTHYNCALLTSRECSAVGTEIYPIAVQHLSDSLSPPTHTHRRAHKTHSSIMGVEPSTCYLYNSPD